MCVAACGAAGKLKEEVATVVQPPTPLEIRSLSMAMAFARKDCASIGSAPPERCLDACAPEKPINEAEIAVNELLNGLNDAETVAKEADELINEAEIVAKLLLNGEKDADIVANDAEALINEADIVAKLFDKGEKEAETVANDADEGLKSNVDERTVVHPPRAFEIRNLSTAIPDAPRFWACTASVLPELCVEACAATGTISEDCAMVVQPPSPFAIRSLSSAMPVAAKPWASI